MRDISVALVVDAETHGEGAYATLRPLTKRGREVLSQVFPNTFADPAAVAITVTEEGYIAALALACEKRAFVTERDEQPGSRVRAKKRALVAEKDERDARTIHFVSPQRGISRCGAEVWPARTTPLPEYVSCKRCLTSIARNKAD